MTLITRFRMVRSSGEHSFRQDTARLWGPGSSHGAACKKGNYVMSRIDGELDRRLHSQAHLQGLCLPGSCGWGV